MKKIGKLLGLTTLMFSVLVFGFGGSIAEAVTYTTAQVATHNTSSDCWVIVNGNVYNLTSFISQHPGGASAIISECGKNGTTAFNNGPHGSGTLNAINSNIIGTLGVSTPNPVLTALTVSPTSPSIMIGGTQQLVTSTKDQNGTSMAATLSFASSNTGVATVNSSTGLVTGVAIGTATITTTAVSGNVTLHATNVITVTNVAPTPIPASVSDRNDDGDDDYYDDEEMSDDDDGEEMNDSDDDEEMNDDSDDEDGDEDHHYFEDYYSESRHNERGSMSYERNNDRDDD